MGKSKEQKMKDFHSTTNSTTQAPAPSVVKWKSLTSPPKYVRIWTLDGGGEYILLAWALNCQEEAPDNLIIIMFQDISNLIV